MQYTSGVERDPLMKENQADERLKIEVALNVV